MDPLSITASIITVISAASAALKRLEDIRARSNPHAELLTVMNMVTDLQATLIVVRDCEESLRNSEMPDAQNGYQGLPDTITKTQKSLDHLVDFSYEKMLRDGKGMARLGLNEKKRRQLSEIRQSIAESHRNLRLVLISANLHQTPVLLSAIHNVSIVQRDHIVKTSATLEQIMTQITTMQAKQRSQPNSIDSNVDASTETFTSLTKTSHAEMFHDQEEVYSSSQLRITTLMPQRACDWTCNCRCHIRSQFRTPQWLSTFVGTLFYSSSNNPCLEARPCNSPKCLRSQPSSSSRFTYYFPTWMMRSALAYSTWNNLNGRNSSWVVKMPNEIDISGDCWYYIENGSIEQIRMLLKERAMTPYDIASDGTTVLHYAIQHWSLDICELLVTAGADWHFKDRNGRSPSDVAWHRILANDSGHHSSKRLRGLIGSEDSYDLCLNALHRILVGLSGADLRTQLELDPSKIDERDWLGTTPLMWAALRGDHTSLQILLSHNAKTNLQDEEMWTAMHHAARSSSLGCIKTLLDTKVDPNARDVNGNTPLHHIANSDASFLTIKECVLALQSRGADIEARDNRGTTPLLQATRFGNSRPIEALLQCGADINSIDWNETSVIAHAIFTNNTNVIQRICGRETKSSWATELHGQDNILKLAAEYGTTETMKVIANSDIPTVECNIEEIRSWFREYRSTLHFKERCSPEEAFVAFEYLVAKKCRPIKGNEGQVEHLEDVPGDRMALVVFDDQRSDDKEAEWFEDVFEHRYPVLPACVYIYVLCSLALLSWLCFC